MPQTGRYRWLICALLFAATAINYIDRQIIGVLKPTLQHEFAWSESDFADVIFWFQVAYALGYIGFGKLVDRIGARLGYAACMLLWTAGNWAVGTTIRGRGQVVFWPADRRQRLGAWAHSFADRGLHWSQTVSLPVSVFH